MPLAAWQGIGHTVEANNSMERAMSQVVAKPSTPCVKRCVLAACQAICTGCGRTRDEIASWGTLTEARRSEIMSMLPDRARMLGIVPLQVPGMAG